MNLILSVDTGDGFQDGFEGNECFSRSLREFDHKCSASKSPVNLASLLS